MTQEMEKFWCAKIISIKNFSLLMIKNLDFSPNFKVIFMVFSQILCINLIKTSHPEIRKNPVKPGRVFSGCKFAFEKTPGFFPGAKSRFSARKKPGLFRISGSGNPAGPGAHPGRHRSPHPRGDLGSMAGGWYYAFTPLWWADKNSRSEPKMSPIQWTW